VQQFGVDFAHLKAASADGLHRIRLSFTRLPVGGPYASVSIKYVGPRASGRLMNSRLFRDFIFARSFSALQSVEKHEKGHQEHVRVITCACSGAAAPF
jgi:hypothetical protein